MSAGADQLRADRAREASERAVADREHEELCTRMDAELRS